MMSDQEQKFSQDYTTPSKTTSQSPEKYAVTVLCSSGKRQSPLSFQEPPPKRTLSFEAPPPHFSQLPQNSPAPLLNQESSGRNSGEESFPFPNPPLFCGESPTNKRLRRMKERMREMSQWWNQVLREDEDDDDDGGQSHNHSCHPKEESESGTENPAQEAVWVEKNGDCLVLHFRCPCGNGYQVLLIGNTCYYKLTTF